MLSKGDGRKFKLVKDTLHSLPSISAVVEDQPLQEP